MFAKGTEGHCRVSISRNDASAEEPFGGLSKSGRNQELLANMRQLHLKTAPVDISECDLLSPDCNLDSGVLCVP